jgi:hypothetical protein
MITTLLAIKDKYEYITTLREDDIDYEERMYDMELKIINTYKQCENIQKNSYYK